MSRKQPPPRALPVAARDPRAKKKQAPRRAASPDELPFVAACAGLEHGDDSEFRRLAALDCRPSSPLTFELIGRAYIASR